MSFFDKKNLKYYLVELLLISFAISSLFYMRNKKWLFALIVFFSFLIIKKYFVTYKKNNINSPNAFFMITLFGVIYVVFLYILGFYFGYYKSTVLFSFWTIRRYILPISFNIVFSELIRESLIVCKNKLSKFLLFLFVFIIDIYVYFGSYDLSKLNDFADVFGYVISASFFNNLFFHYYCKNFNSKGIISFKLITVLYPFVIPIIPDLFTFLQTFIKITYAYIMYYFMNETFSNQKKIGYNNKQNTILAVLIFSFSAVICMLISCKFKYGLMVVASESMHGTFEKGDAVLFVGYSDQTLNKGDIILFKYDDIILIHRIVNISRVGLEYRYVTKGDDNGFNDSGYSTKDTIVGKYIIHIKYIGYPTLWIRDIFGL